MGKISKIVNRNPELGSDVVFLIDKEKAKVTIQQGGFSDEYDGINAYITGKKIFVVGQNGSAREVSAPVSKHAGEVPMSTSQINNELSRGGRESSHTTINSISGNGTFLTPPVQGDTIRQNITLDGSFFTNLFSQAAQSNQRNQGQRQSQGTTFFNTERTAHGTRNTVVIGPGASAFGVIMSKDGIQQIPAPSDTPSYRPGR